MMEITCLDRFDNGVDISDMSNHSTDHHRETMKAKNKIRQTNEIYDNEDSMDDEYDGESESYEMQLRHFACWLKLNYVDIARGIGSKYSYILVFHILIIE